MEDGNNTAARIRQVLSYGVDIFYLPQVTSTSSALKSMRQMMRFSRPTLLFTDSQTEGRGTRGRNWLQAPQRDLALSLALADTTPNVLDPRLSLSVGAVCAAAIEAELSRQQQIGDAALEQPALSLVSPPGQNTRSDLRLRLKWPNDICAETAPGRYSKLGGILLERSRGWTYIGVGLNINSLISDFPAELSSRITTLRELEGRELHRWGLISALSVALINQLGMGVDNELLFADWKLRDCSGGTRYLLGRGGASIAVRALRVDSASGALICGDEAGNEYSVVSYSELEEAPLLATN